MHKIDLEVLTIEYPKVFIVIVNWNGKVDTVECLESLKRIDYPDYKVVVVDNGSSDGSQDEIRKISDITLIENNRNLGYAGAVNVGIDYALKNGAGYVSLLSYDFIVDKDFLKELVNVSESDKQIGIVGPIVYFFGEPNRVQDLGGYISLTGLIKGNRSMKPEYGMIDTGQFDRIKYVNFITGGASLIKKSVIEKIGMFDPSYFLYFEDTDYGMRAKRAGFELVAVPKSKAWHKTKFWPKSDLWHKEKASTKRDELITYYFTRNRLIFVRKYFSKPQLLIFIITYFFRYSPLDIASSLLKYRSLSRFKLYLRAVRDGLLNISGPLNV